MESTKSDIIYGWSPLAELLDEGLADLVVQHWEEIALDKEEVHLDVDWDRKIALESVGSFKVFTAHRDSVLLGYISFYIHEHAINYKSTRYIFDDVFWLHPDERGTGVGKEMISRAFAALPRPSKLQVKTKLTFEGGRVGKLMEHLGLTPIETVYSTLLK